MWVVTPAGNFLNPPFRIYPFSDFGKLENTLASFIAFRHTNCNCRQWLIAKAFIWDGLSFYSSPPLSSSPASMAVLAPALLVNRFHLMISRMRPNLPEAWHPVWRTFRNRQKKKIATRTIRVMELPLAKGEFGA